MINNTISTTQTSLFLMANLGAEVSRLISAKENNDQVLMLGALQRAEQMLDKIKSLPDIQPRITEINTLSEVIHSLAYPTTSLLHVSPQNIKSYFIPFATRLMA